MLIGCNESAKVSLDHHYSNRHGMIAGAIGTGKSVPPMVLAECCSKLDVPCFLADAEGDLADLTARLGMQRVALQLCRYLEQWPRDPQARHYGLLAMRLLSQPTDQRAEANLLLEQPANQWSDLPQRREIDTMRRHLARFA